MVGSGQVDKWQRGHLVSPILNNMIMVGHKSPGNNELLVEGEEINTMNRTRSGSIGGEEYK